MAILLLALVAAGAARADDSVAVALNQPSRITPRAQTGLFTAIARAGPRLVAVGEAGRILLSDDDGKTWRQVATPTSVTLTNVRFVDAAQGWAIGQMGVVLHTLDAGAHWARQLDGLTANNITLAAAEADIAAHGATPANTANLQSAQALAGGGPSVPFLGLLAVAPRHLLLLGGFGLAMQTTDAGATWTSIADELANPLALHLYGAVRVQNSVLVVGEQGLVLAGPAAGPFNPVATPFGGTYFGAIVATDGTVLAYGLQGTIIASSDQGAHWRLANTGTGNGIDAALALQGGGLLFGDAGGNLLLTGDDGKTFEITQAPQPVAALAQAQDGAIIIGGPAGLQRLTGIAGAAP